MALKMLLMAIINVLKIMIIFPLSIWLSSLFMDDNYHPEIEERKMLALCLIGSITYIAVIALVFCTEFIKKSEKFDKTLLLLKSLLSVISVSFPIVVICAYPEGRRKVYREGSNLWYPLLIWTIMMLTLGVFQFITLTMFLILGNKKRANKS